MLLSAVLLFFVDMTIAFDAKRAFFNNRGLGNYSRDTIRILSSYYPTEDFFLFSPKKKNGISFERGENCEIIFPSGIMSKFPSLWRSHFMLNDLAKNNIAVYHGLSNELPLGIEKTSIKTVVTIHDLIFLTHPHLYSPIDRRLFRYKYLKSAQIADVVVAISEQTKRDLIEIGGIDEKKIEVVYQGCNPIFSSVHSEEDKNFVLKKYNLPANYMLSVGAIERRKNHQLILRAMAKGKINCPLVILGRPTEYLSELKRLISDLKLEKQVIFLKNIPLLDLSMIYQNATLFLYPSVYEGFGIPIVEAMMSKVPVITSKGSCFRETGGDAACYVDANDEQELESAILSRLESEDLRKEMIRKGNEHIKKFSDQFIAEQMMSIYKKITK